MTIRSTSYKESIIIIHVPRIRRVELLIEPGQSLGLMIRGGMEYGLGIYITGVDKDSVADRAGLMVRVFVYIVAVSSCCGRQRYLL